MRVAGLVAVGFAGVACGGVAPPHAVDGAAPFDGAADATLVDAEAPQVGATIQGAVVNLYGHPLGGIRVALVGGAGTTSDASGRFTLEGASEAYDLAVFDDVSGRAIVYQGLTRSDPTVSLIPTTLPATPPVELERRATIDGHVTPWPPASPFSPEAVVHVVSRTRDSTDWNAFDTTAANAEGTFASLFPLAWHGPSTATASVRVLHWRQDVAAGVPRDYVELGETTGVPLTDGTSTHDILVEMSPVGNAGAITAGALLPFPMSTQIGAAILFDDGASVYVAGVGSDTVTLPALDHPTATMLFVLDASDGTRYVSMLSPGHVGGDVVVLAPPPPPEPLTPTNGAVDVSSSTLFSFTPYPGGVHTVAVVQDDLPEPVGRLLIFTARSELRIPDLEKHGFSLQPNAHHFWTLGAVAPPDSVDDLEPALLFGATHRLPTVVTTRGGWFGGGFTTAP